MVIKELREAKRYSLTELCSIFNKNEDETKEIMKILGLYNISRRTSTMTSEEIKMESLLDEEEAEKVEEPNTYVFKFVGIVQIRDRYLIIHPKYIKNFNKYIEEENKVRRYSDIRQLIDVIRKYKNKREQSQNTNSDNKEESFSLLSLALDLYYDYYENGLYHSENVIVEENGEGEILWEKTINEQTAYFVDNRPIYLDVYTVNTETNEEDFFRRLHSCVITKCCNEVKELFEILNLEPITISSDDIEDFGDSEYVLKKLKQELNIQFVTKKQKQLNMIKTYLTGNKNYDKDEEVKFIGSTSFNLIWEDVCSVVMENSLDKKIKDLGFEKLLSEQNNNLNLNENTYLKEIIEKPKWYFSNNNSNDMTYIQDSKETLKPDIVTVKKEKKEIYIYDAKYYNIILEEGKDLKNYPGIGDITKQYLYELAFREIAENNKFKIVKNAFLMPIYIEETKNNEKIKESCRKIGKVEFNLMNALITNSADKLNDIEIIVLPVNEVYSKYLQ